MRRQQTIGILLGALVALALLLLSRSEGYQNSVKRIEAQNAAGCPCADASDCVSFDCRAGLCRDSRGALPAERGELRCARQLRFPVTSYRRQGDLAPELVKKYAAVGDPGCPCRESTQCRYSRCRAGRCTNWFGFIPWEEPTGCPRV
jgi:hypothetical protein